MMIRGLLVVMVAALLGYLPACTRTNPEPPPVVLLPEEVAVEAFFVKLFSNRDFVERLRRFIAMKNSLARSKTTEEAYQKRLAEIDKQWKEQVYPIFSFELKQAGLTEAMILRACPRYGWNSEYLDRLYSQMTPESRQALAPDKPGVLQFISGALWHICETLRASAKDK